MSMFLWCAVIGCGVLVLALVLDGLFDGLDDLLFEGALPVLACALGVFGAVGLAVEALAGQATPAIALGVPAVGAVLSGALTRRVWTRLRREMPRNAVPMTPGELVGTEVRVLWWKDGRGEVAATTRGHQATLPARSEGPLRSGAIAWVTDTDDAVLILTDVNGTDHTDGGAPSP
ncbi:MAG: nodulation protein NfeD [Actinomyces sp.]|uniref:nodulation protein NfeD n=1 Tax=Actinomyces sp. TaxID=29317 RepID=UPI0026DD8C20|nr:nodulation protein NfeD [Actinomyces sp.]MDO4242730.1 nodulation protein NfeD [Actinomyces sp.]